MALPFARWRPTQRRVPSLAMKHIVILATLALTSIPARAAVECSANCGGVMRSTIISIPMHITAETPELGIEALKKRCDSRVPSGVLFAAFSIVSNRVQVYEVQKYSDIDLIQFACGPTP